MTILHQQLEESNDKVVVLRDVDRASEGQYICEVMGEGPTFKTTNATVKLTVAGPSHNTNYQHNSQTHSLSGPSHTAEAPVEQRNSVNILLCQFGWRFSF